MWEWEASVHASRGARLAASTRPGPLTRGAVKPRLSRRRQDRRQDFAEMVNAADGCRRYSAIEPRLVDPEGDANLIRQLDLLPGYLTDMVKRGSVAQKLKALASRLRGGSRVGPVSARQSRSNEEPVDVERLLEVFKGIVRDHLAEMSPRVGAEHIWSPEAKRYNRLGFFHRLRRHIEGKQGFPMPILGQSKLLLTLACGWTSRYLPTGKEQALHDRLMTYADGSARIEDVLRESYLLNRGDLYRTLLTAENVLARNIYWTNRGELPLTRKLVYLLKDGRGDGDNYGAWYHFFGTALYGLMRPGWVAKAVAATESAGSLLIEGPDPQEDRINLAGARFGGALQRMIREAATPPRAARPARADGH